MRPLLLPEPEAALGEGSWALPGRQAGWEAEPLPGGGSSDPCPPES